MPLPPASPPPPSIIPAQLGFLAIYNPSLGTSDDTLDDQILYYASVTTLTSGAGSNRRRRSAPVPSRDERNQRLRHIGLAQGMVEFGRSFSGGAPVDTIDTEHSRVVLHELEPGWWILAVCPPFSIPYIHTNAGDQQSIDLTRLPTTGTTYEPSTRDLKPASLLLADLLRAHAIFLLHHAPSLAALFVRAQARDKFSALLSRYWDQFLAGWTVLMHGNPATSVLGGIKIAGSGELGVGVGEEERGSGERDVLEGMVGGTEGLVDLVVGRFDGEGEGGWLGRGEEVGAEDGAVFLGVGAVSRGSVRALVGWLEDVWVAGEGAYGVGESPGSTRRRARRRRKVVEGGEKEEVEVDGEGAGMDKIFSYLKLGYGTAWGAGSAGSAATSDAHPPSPRPHKDTPPGEFLIGLTGDLHTDDAPTEEPEDHPEDTNPRIVVRTVSVELESPAFSRPESTITKDLGSPAAEHPPSASPHVNPHGHITSSTTPSFDAQDRNKTHRLRVVVYAARPFLYLLLFHPTTDSLAWEPFYHNLHARLAPIHAGMLASTGYRPERPGGGGEGDHGIYDLVWDPRGMTVHSTIPNIPVPGGTGGVWTRAEALGTHMQMLNVLGETRRIVGECERTGKTRAGWWVVWNRVLEEEEGEAVVGKEVFLVRRASDATGAAGLLGVGGGGGRNGGLGTEGRGWADGASRLAQGIGVDTRRYVEGLLSLNR